MKVFFLIQGFNVAASRYRVLHYFPYFEEKGIETDAAEFPRGLTGWKALLPKLKGADVLFVQRKRLPLYLLLMLKRMNKKIVFDFDDAIMFKNSLSADPYSLRRRMSFKRMLKFTDLVIAGNEFLKNEAEKYHGRVSVLPTPIDERRYRAKKYEQSGQAGSDDKTPVTIGWIGDHGSIHYVESYKDVWEALGRKYGASVSLSIICDTFIETRDIETRKVQWTYDSEIDSLVELDIGVMPLFDDLWSKGKCGYKIIQYLGVGVPAVCTPVGINRDVVEDGINGFWAQSKEEWAEKLSTLIEDRELRARMGKAGRKEILDHYTVQVCGPRLVEWVRNL